MLSLEALKIYASQILLLPLIWCLFLYGVSRQLVGSDKEELVLGLQHIWNIIAGCFGPPFILLWILYSHYGIDDEEVKSKGTAGVRELIVYKHITILWTRKMISVLQRILGKDSTSINTAPKQQLQIQYYKPEHNTAENLRQELINVKNTCTLLQNKYYEPKDTTIENLEEKLTKLEITRKRLQTRYYELDENYEEQSAELAHEKAVGADNLRQLDEFAAEYAEVERRVSEKLEKEKEVEHEAIKKTYRTEKDKMVNMMEERHICIIDNLKLEHDLAVHKTRRDISAKHNLEKQERLAVIKDLELKIEALNRALVSGDSATDELSPTNKALKEALNRVEKELSESSLKVSDNLLTITSQKFKIRQLEKKLSDSDTHTNQLNVKVNQLEEDLATSSAGFERSLKIAHKQLLNKERDLAFVADNFQKLRRAYQDVSERKAGAENALMKKNEEVVMVSAMLKESRKEATALNLLVEAINKKLPRETAFQSITDGTSLALIRREDASNSSSGYMYPKITFHPVVVSSPPRLHRRSSLSILNSLRCQAVVKYSFANDCRASIFGQPVQSFVAVVKVLLICEAKRRRIEIEALSNGIKLPVRCSGPRLCNKRSLDDATLDSCSAQQAKRRASDSDRVELSPKTKTLLASMIQQAKLLKPAKLVAIPRPVETILKARERREREAKEKEMLIWRQMIKSKQLAADEMDISADLVECEVEDVVMTMDVEKVVVVVVDDDAMDVEEVEVVDDDAMDITGDEERPVLQDAMDLSE